MSLQAGVISGIAFWLVRTAIFTRAVAGITWVRTHRDITAEDSPPHSWETT